jgi:protein SCO1
MIKNTCLFVFLSALSFAIFSCDSSPSVSDEKLPIIGERLGFTPNGDTIYPTIANFTFTNQNGAAVTNATFAEKAYIVDFFFTSCPTICPKVMKQMLRVHDRFKDSAGVLLLSHTIDPKRDSVGKLRVYAENLGVATSKWHFVTGVKDSLYSLADDYFSIAKEDPYAPGGFDHSGRLILVDKNRHVRSFCDGTDEKDVERFMKDVEKLLKEQAMR